MVWRARPPAHGSEGGVAGDDRRTTRHHSYTDSGTSGSAAVVAIPLAGRRGPRDGVDTRRARSHQRRIASLWLLDTALFALNIGWRLCFAFGALLGLGILYVRRGVPESPRWLFIHGSENLAVRVVEEIEAQVRSDLGTVLHGWLTTWSFIVAVAAIFFLASAGTSSAYLTVSEIFPMDTRALAIAFFYAIGTAVGGITGPLLFGNLIGSGHLNLVAIGFFVGAGVMALGGIAELAFGVRAEGVSLENIGKPITVADAERAAQGERPLSRERDVRIRRRASRRFARDRHGLRRVRPGPGGSLYSPGMLGTASRWAPSERAIGDRADSSPRSARPSTKDGPVICRTTGTGRPTPRNHRRHGDRPSARTDHRLCPWRPTTSTGRAGPPSYRFLGGWPRFGRRGGGSAGC